MAAELGGCMGCRGLSFRRRRGCSSGRGIRCVEVIAAMWSWLLWMRGLEQAAERIYIY